MLEIVRLHTAQQSRLKQERHVAGTGETFVIGTPTNDDFLPPWTALHAEQAGAELCQVQD